MIISRAGGQKYDAFEHILDKVQIQNCMAHCMKASLEGVTHNTAQNYRRECRNDSWARIGWKIYARQRPRIDTKSYCRKWVLMAKARSQLYRVEKKKPS